MVKVGNLVGEMLLRMNSKQTFHILEEAFCQWLILVLIQTNPNCKYIQLLSFKNDLFSSFFFPHELCLRNQLYLGSHSTFPRKRTLIINFLFFRECIQTFSRKDGHIFPRKCCTKEILEIHLKCLYHISSSSQFNSF